MGKDDYFRNCIITAENNVLVALDKEIVIMDDSLATVKSIKPRKLDPCIWDGLLACNESFEKSYLLLTFYVKKTCSKFKLDYTAETSNLDSWVTKVTW